MRYLKALVPKCDEASTRWHFVRALPVGSAVHVPTVRGGDVLAGVLQAAQD